MTGGDAEKMKQAEVVFNECNVTQDGEECEVATKIAICLKESSVKNKIMLGI